MQVPTILKYTLIVIAIKAIATSAASIIDIPAIEVETDKTKKNIIQMKTQPSIHQKIYSSKATFL